MNFSSIEDKKRLLESITCKKCAEVYNSGSKKPCNLTCGHSVCHECIGQIIGEESENNNNIVSCPVDGKNSHLSLSNLPVNFDLLNLANLYNKQRPPIRVIKRALETIPNKFNVRISLYRDSMSVRYGFYFKQLPQPNPIFIAGEVRPFSIAFNGGLRNDDWVVEVNGLAIKNNFKYQEFSKLIKKYKNELHLVVCRGHGYKFNDSRNDEVVEKKEEEKEKEIIYRIISRQSRSSEYGFAVRNEGAAFLVARVDPGSACAHGGLRVGEKIVEVNGHDVLNLPYNDLITLINSTKRMLIFGVKESNEN